jgi:hypothetical protein
VPERGRNYLCKEIRTLINVSQSEEERMFDIDVERCGEKVGFAGRIKISPVQPSPDQT